MYIINQCSATQSLEIKYLTLNLHKLFSQRIKNIEFLPFKLNVYNVVYMNNKIINYTINTCTYLFKKKSRSIK